MGKTPGKIWEGCKWISNLVHKSFVAGNGMDICSGADGQLNFAGPTVWEEALEVSAAAELGGSPEARIRLAA